MATEVTKKLWLTYSWKDNDDGDVDFIVQALQDRGLDVHLDRRDIAAGKRLWEQIAGAIQNPEQSDVWAFLVSQNSLNSQACQEELAYALDRALSSRGDTYPLMGIVYGAADISLPAALKVRLFVSLQDPDWLDRIYEGAYGRGLGRLPGTRVAPYYLAIHPMQDGSFLIEVRPRAGTWSPFIVAIPRVEADSCFKRMRHGPRGGPEVAGPFFGGALFDYIDSRDDQRRYIQASNEASPTQSYYLHFSDLPSELVFGRRNGPQYRWLKS